MFEGYGYLPVTSRAAQAELDRQKAKRDTLVALAPDDEPGRGSGGGGGGEPKKKGGSSKGSGRKDDVQRKPEDQKGRADPKEGEGRGAY